MSLYAGYSLLHRRHLMRADKIALATQIERDEIRAREELEREREREIEREREKGSLDDVLATYEVIDKDEGQLGTGGSVPGHKPSSSTGTGGDKKEYKYEIGSTATTMHSGGKTNKRTVHRKSSREVILKKRRGGRPPVHRGLPVAYREVTEAFQMFGFQADMSSLVTKTALEQHDATDVSGSAATVKHNKLG